MTHTWADVAYSFVNGSGVEGSVTPLEFVAGAPVVAFAIYIWVRYAM